MPAATRISDADVTHCTTPFRAQGSPNVCILYTSEAADE